MDLRTRAIKSGSQRTSESRGTRESSGHGSECAMNSHGFSDSLALNSHEFCYSLLSRFLRFRHAGLLVGAGRLLIALAGGLVVKRSGRNRRGLLGWVGLAQM